MATEKKVIKRKFYVKLKDVGASDKCPPQAKLIIDTIAAAGGKVLRDDLIKLLSRPVEQGGLKTNQTPERILGFYRPRLNDMGVVREVVEEETIEVEVPDKPAKEDKPAAEGAGTAGKAPAKQDTKTKGEQKAA